MHSQVHRNLILASLPDDAKSLLAPELEAVEFAAGTTLDSAGYPSAQMLFPESGIIAVVAGEEPVVADVGFIGREAFTGVHLVYGDDLPALKTAVRIGGWGYAIAASRCKEVLRRSNDLRMHLLLGAKLLAMQFAMSATSASRAVIHQRLARLLLMVDDRHDGGGITLAHHDIAAMLGARRQSITESLHRLEGEGLISAQRKDIRVLDRHGLEVASGGFYGAAEAEFERLFRLPLRKRQSMKPLAYR